MAILLSLLISTIYGKRIINYLQTKQIGESVRELGLQGQSEKAGTPTMGGIIIIISTLTSGLTVANNVDAKNAPIPNYNTYINILKIILNIVKIISKKFGICMY